MIAILQRFLILSLLVPLILGCSESNGPESGPADQQKGFFPAPNLPDSLSEIDIDGDAKIDYALGYIAVITDDSPSSQTTYFLDIMPQDSNRVNYALSQGTVPLDAGTLINDDLEWAQYGTSLISINGSRASGWDSVWSGPWANVSEKYVALKFFRNDSLFFGWLQMSVDADSGSYVLHGHNYNPQSGAKIIAGQVLK